MIDSFLKARLKPIVADYRRFHLWRGLAICWAVVAVVAGGLVLFHRLTGGWFSFTIPLLLASAAIAAVIVWRRSYQREPEMRWVVRQIEQEYPELKTLLLTAAEQRPDSATGELSYLQQRVIREALEHRRTHAWGQPITQRLFFAQCAHSAALILLVAVMFGLRVSTPVATTFPRFARGGVTVTPGDVSIERGSSLVVLARFDGPLPPDATLVIGPSADDRRSVPLVKNLADPVFGGSIPEVNTNVAYHIQYAGSRTRDFKVTVFDYPALQRADAQITFPEFTGLPEKRIDDTRRVSAVEGSRLDLTMQLNKPVASARLIARDKSVIPLQTGTNEAQVLLKKFTLEASKSYELQLVDAEGRTNKISAQFVFSVLTNRTPELKLAFPRGDQRVSPLQEIAFQAEAWDDFGLRAYGFSYMTPGGEIKTVSLRESLPPQPVMTNRQTFNYVLNLENLGTQPDDLISYFVWADDVGPDGQIRRTSSDMYFAEVRPFEEIFREGQSMDGESGGQQQQQQGGNQTLRLADLQKQIISATWNLQRHSGGKPRSATFE